MDEYKNFAVGTVAVAPVPPTTGLALTVTAGQSALYPPPPFNAVVCPATALPVASNAEILRVTAVVGDVFTIARTQEGSSVRAILAGDQIYQGITEKLIDDLFAAMTPGPAGPAGPTGPAGPQGPIGPTGPAGPATEVADATYWVVSAHGALTNARVLSALANGYVKITGGVPHTVATIPIGEGGTGSTSAADARTNLGLGTLAVQNADAVAITGGTISVTSVFASGNLLAAGNLQVSGFASASLFAGDGSSLTTLNAGALSHGLAHPARLGSGTPDATTVLFGDSTWKPANTIFPSGLLVLADFPCPPGWTRVALEGFFLRLGPTPGATGGTATHAHGPGSFSAQDHQHGPGTYAATRHSHSGSFSVAASGATQDAGTHGHGYGGSISGTTGLENAGSLNVDAGASGLMARASHGHSFGANYSGTTDPAGVHQHPFSLTVAGPVTVGDAEPLVFGLSGFAGAGAIVGSSGEASHLPTFLDLFLCRKN